MVSVNLLGTPTPSLFLSLLCKSSDSSSDCERVRLLGPRRLEGVVRRKKVRHTKPTEWDLRQHSYKCLYTTQMTWVPSMDSGQEREVRSRETGVFPRWDRVNPGIVILLSTGTGVKGCWDDS